jgi:hypothetical protein
MHVLAAFLCSHIHHYRVLSPAGHPWSWSTVPSMIQVSLKLIDIVAEQSIVRGPLDFDPRPDGCIRSYSYRHARESPRHVR